jgi:hypothetical protein
MSTNDIIQIGPYKYIIRKREAHRILVSWIESNTGDHKEIWLLIKDSGKVKI